LTTTADWHSLGTAATTLQPRWRQTSLVPVKSQKYNHIKSVGMTIELPLCTSLCVAVAVAVAVLSIIIVITIPIPIISISISIIIIIVYSSRGLAK